MCTTITLLIHYSKTNLRILIINPLPTWVKTKKSKNSHKLYRCTGLKTKFERSRNVPHHITVTKIELNLHLSNPNPKKCSNLTQRECTTTRKRAKDISFTYMVKEKHSPFSSKRRKIHCQGVIKKNLHATTIKLQTPSSSLGVKLFESRFQFAPHETGHWKLVPETRDRGEWAFLTKVTTSLFWGHLSKEYKERRYTLIAASATDELATKTNVKSQSRSSAKDATSQPQLEPRLTTEKENIGFRRDKCKRNTGRTIKVCERYLVRGSCTVVYVIIGLQIPASVECFHMMIRLISNTSTE